MDIVQRVTRHKTVVVVLKHYFRPGREDFRRTMENAMQRLFLHPFGQAQAESALKKALPAGGMVRDASGNYPEQATPARLARVALACLETMTTDNWVA